MAGETDPSAWSSFTGGVVSGHESVAAGYDEGYFGSYGQAVAEVTGQATANLQVTYFAG